MKKFWFAAFALGAVFTLAASSASAQNMDGRWLPYIGCWEAVGGEDEVGLLCFTPDGSGVELANIVDGEVVSREQLVADGAQREVAAEGCEGWESIQFSQDGRRAFTRTEFLCEEGEARSGTGVMTFMAPNMWSDIRTLDVGGEPFTWVQDYQLVGIDRLGEENIEDPAAEMRFEVRAARNAAAGAIDLGDVEEAVAMMDAKAVETWIVSQSDALDPTGEDLVRLADAGVPENVIDAVVAVSHPDRFVVESSGEIDHEGPRPTHYRGYMAFNPFWGPAWGLNAGYGFGYGPWGYDFGPAYYYFGRRSFGGYYSPYYGYGRGYGYGYWGSRPGTIIIDRRSNGGRVVNGRGYSQSGDTGSGQARRRSGTGSPAYSTGGSRSGSSASGSQGSRPGRSATPRRGVRRPSGGAAASSQPRRSGSGSASSSRPRRPSGGAASSSSQRRPSGSASSSSQRRSTPSAASSQRRSSPPAASSQRRPSRPSASSSRSRPSTSSARPPARSSSARPSTPSRRPAASRPSGSSSRGSASRSSGSSSRGSASTSSRRRGGR